MPQIFIDLFLLVCVGFVIYMVYGCIRNVKKSKYQKIAASLDELKKQKEVDKKVEEVQHLIEEIKQERSHYKDPKEIEKEIKRIFDEGDKFLEK